MIDYVFYGLVGFSFLIAAMQDVRERAVSDLVWLPAAAGSILLVYFNQGSFWFVAVETGFIGAIAVVSVLLGMVGQADAIAVLLLAINPNKFGFVEAVAVAGIVAGLHGSYLLAKGMLGRRIVSTEEFAVQQQWIPVAMIRGDKRLEVTEGLETSRERVLKEALEGDAVEVKYGTPVVLYFAIGYLVMLLLNF